MKKRKIRAVGKGPSNSELLSINMHLCKCLAVLSKSQAVIRKRNLQKIRAKTDELRGILNKVLRIYNAKSIPQIRNIAKEL